MISRITDTPISSHQVFTGAVLTNARAQRALIDITSAEGESYPVRTHNVKLLSSRSWAGLAGGTPAHGLADGYDAAAACGSGDCHG